MRVPLTSVMMIDIVREMVSHGNPFLDTVFNSSTDFNGQFATKTLPRNINSIILKIFTATPSFLQHWSKKNLNLIPKVSIFETKTRISAVFAYSKDHDTIVIQPLKNTGDMSVSS